MSIKNEMINIIKHHYEEIPTPILNMIGAVGNQFGYGLRYGKSFSKVYEELRKTEFFSEEELDNIVKEKLIEQIKYAYKYVPYYRENYNENDVKTMDSLSDIERFPFIDKEIVKSNEDQFISDKFKKSELIQKKTSGSTGMPLAIYMNKDTTLKEWAFVVHIWERIGFTSKSSRILMREIEDKNKGICYFDGLKNELRIDISNMTPENMEIYCKAIERYKPDYIHGYPSATLQLCKFIEKRGIKHQFKGVLPSSEGMSKEEVNYIKRVLNCPCLSFYGHTERLVMAGQCECSECYHVEPLYGYCELIDKNGEVIREEGKTGEIVATGFCNTGMPLIRYKTGDLAEWSLKKCSCGRNYKLLKKLEGRTTEYLVDCNNNKISLTAFRYSFYEQHVNSFQFYQDEPGKVFVRIIPEEDFTELDKRNILKTLEEDCDSQIEFCIEKVKSISKKKSGKRELIIQKLGK
jgi:phenylacetate-CoA ligase